MTGGQRGSPAVGVMGTLTSSVPCLADQKTEAREPLALRPGRGPAGLWAAGVPCWQGRGLAARGRAGRWPGPEQRERLGAVWSSGRLWLQGLSPRCPPDGRPGSRHEAGQTACPRPLRAAGPSGLQRSASCGTRNAHAARLRVRARSVGAVPCRCPRADLSFVSGTRPPRASWWPWSAPSSRRSTSRCSGPSW